MTGGSHSREKVPRNAPESAWLNGGLECARESMGLERDPVKVPVSIGLFAAQ